jgi:signal transduction histidine kinase
MPKDQADKNLALAGLAHDLNNVLQTVAHVADILSTEKHWSAESDLLLRCVDRGRAILQSVQEVPGEVDVHAVASRAAKSAERIQVRIEVASGLVFAGKPLAFERALMNLLWNSARAGASECCIAAGREENGYRIEVSDNGPGIPEANLSKVFNPGFSTTASTGLGLQIVEAIIQDHGGSIEALNRGGACFRIRIPA